MLKPLPCFYAAALACLLLWPLAGQAQDAAAGKEIYEQYCALCHGPEGKGDGSLSANLDPKPRNHTDGAYMNALSDDRSLERHRRRRWRSRAVAHHAGLEGHPVGAADTGRGRLRAHAGRAALCAAG